MDLLQLTARAQQISDLYDQLNTKKIGKTWTRLQIAQGFVGDVGALQKQAMAKEGLRDMENIDEGLAHQLADCLWCVLVLAQKYGVDLKQSFIQTMDELEEKIQEQL